MSPNTIQIPIDQTDLFTQTVAGLQTACLKFDSKIVNDNWVINITGH